MPHPFQVSSSSIEAFLAGSAALAGRPFFVESSALVPARRDANARIGAVDTTAALEDQDVRTFFEAEHASMRDAAADRFPPFPCNAPSAGLLGINFSQVNRGNRDSKMSFAV